MDRAQRLGSAVSIFQANLHWNALLVGSVLRSPNPPITLGIHTLSQAIIGKPCALAVFFQKKSRLHLSRCLLVWRGSSKHCIECAGRASKWD